MSSWEGFEVGHHGRGLNCVIMGGVCTVSSWEGFQLCHHGRLCSVSLWDWFERWHQWCHHEMGLNCAISSVIMEGA